MSGGLDEEKETAQREKESERDSARGRKNVTWCICRAVQGVEDAYYELN